MQKIIDFIKRHLILVIVTLAIMAVAIILVIVLNIKTATLVFRVAPYDATITINDQIYANNTTHNFKPGNYTAVVSKYGFKDQTIELILENNKTTYLNTYLMNIMGGGEDFEYYKTNYDDLYFLREYSNSHPEDEKLKIFLDDYDRAQTIKDILPLYSYDAATGESYYIFYETGSSQCNLLYCLEIGASSENSMISAMQKIIDNGYDIDDYQIIRSFD